MQSRDILSKISDNKHLFDAYNCVSVVLLPELAAVIIHNIIDHNYKICDDILADVEKLRQNCQYADITRIKFDAIPTMYIQHLKNGTCVMNYRCDIRFSVFNTTHGTWCIDTLEHKKLVQHCISKSTSLTLMQKSHDFSSIVYVNRRIDQSGKILQSANKEKRALNAIRSQTAKRDLLVFDVNQ